MRADGMGRGVARLYATRRQALDQYVPMWVPPGQGRQSAGQSISSDNSLKNKAGQGGRGRQGTKTILDENTGERAYEKTPEGARHPVAGVRLHGPDLCLVHPVHPVPASIGAGSSWTSRGRDASSTLSELRPWTDDRGWISEIVRAEPGDPKIAALFWWVIAAGGWIDGTTALLPTLPACMAKLELPRMLRQHRIAVREVCNGTACPAEVMRRGEIT